MAGADYSASKAAVICLTKSLAKAGAPYGIRVNSVAPGAIYSPMLDQYYEDHINTITDRIGITCQSIFRDDDGNLPFCFLSYDRPNDMRNVPWFNR